MNDAFPLRTPRLILTPPTDQDIDAIFRIHADARTYQHRPDLAMKNRKEAEELARTWQENWDEQGLGYYLSLIHISEPTRRHHVSRMPSSA